MLIALAYVLTIQGVSVRDDIVLTRFVNHAYDGWAQTGTAFSRGTAHDESIAKLEIAGAVSNDVVSSELEGDGPQGSLVSPEFKVQRRYLTFLIGGGDAEMSTCLNLVVHGRVVKSATGRRSDHLSPVTWDLKAWEGQSLKLELIDKASGDWGHVNVDQILLTDDPVTKPLNMGKLYSEPLRPLYHFTARQWTVDRLNPGMRQEGWVNDLNGLIFVDGVYHLFAQRWAKCWIHATSRDLVHWQEQPPAFWEESEGSGVQSGSCVLDVDNSSGLSPDKSSPPLLAFWSRFDNRSQCLSYSLDKGKTWELYPGNPIMERPERDPKVFWYEPGKHWVMVMYGGEAYHILTSKDLLHWTDEHHPIAQSFECPDFFELPVDQRSDKKKWVLIQGNGQYSCGTFDGHEFHEETERHPCDVGPNFYATQTWANMDQGDGRRVQCAWMRGSDFPDMPFNQQISFPCELTLRSTPAGLRLFRKPVREIQSLQHAPREWVTLNVSPGSPVTLSESGRAFRIVGNTEIPEGARLVLNVGGEKVVLESHGLRSGTVVHRIQEHLKSFEFLLDTASVEVFLNQGELSSTQFVLPKEKEVRFEAEGGTVRINELKVFPLQSSWTRAPLKP